jgi:ElaB/YqjD/DUF883 family membrane-anchored ribosome-binding protein
MGEIKRTSHEIQAEIDRLRESLTRDVRSLELSVRNKLDWRRPIRERPVLCVGVALGVGVVIGLL